MIVVNANSADYTGWVWFYLDNMKFSGGGIVLNPKPATGAKDVDVNTQLSWMPASTRSRTSCTWARRRRRSMAPMVPAIRVSFVQLDGTSFDPNSLAFNTQYFWRVDAVNDVNPDSPWKGAVWDFTTANFIIVDDDATRTPRATGSTRPGSMALTLRPPTAPWSANSSAPFAERTTVHTGLQSMPLTYDNTKAKTSEAVRTWTEPQDWTLNGFNTMKFYVYGAVSNGADSFDIMLEDMPALPRRAPSRWS